MRRLTLFLICIALACAASADTLHLTNGQVINGMIAGRSSSGVRFTGPDGRTLFYPFEEVQSMNFGPLPPAAPPPPAPGRALVPVGTVLLVRMTDGLSTKDVQTGQIFTATLATNLAANGYVFAPAGTTVYGQVVDASQAHRGSGTSKLQVELTQIVIGGTATPIVTNVYDTQGKSSTRRSFRRLFGGAGLGAAIGGIAGNAGMGAAIGAVSGAALSMAQKGDPADIQSEQQLQFTLQQPVMLTIMQ